MGAGKQSRVGSAAWYRQHQHDPIYPGAAITVLQAAFLILTMKLDLQLRSTAVDKICRRDKEVLLPRGNLYPPSLHTARQLVGCKSLRVYEHHACVNDCHTWDPLPKSNTAHTQGIAAPRSCACTRCPARASSLAR